MMIIFIFVIIIVAFKRTRTIYVVFQSRGFYDVPWVLISDARSFQALAPILDWLTIWPRFHAGIDPMPRKMNLDHPCQAALLWISKVRGYDRVCSRCSAKKTLKSQVIKQQNTANTLF